MPVLSQTAEYALRAVVYLAASPGRPIDRVGELADELGIPQNYLSKTLAQLVRIGILTSSRGKRGGFGLARPPESVSLDEIVAPFDDVGRGHCLLGRSVCSDRTACQAHAAWKVVSEEMAAFFRNTTVADILNGDEPGVTPIPGHRTTRSRPPAR